MCCWSLGLLVSRTAQRPYRSAAVLLTDVLLSGRTDKCSTSTVPHVE
ncbi:hypothetical protein T261_7200 [Streptomyces lydicus]|nr:hypothetical protein T261_7200 [Streptomyces lydicus]